ncbi:PH domain-containing protein [Streptomyces sp. NPDC002055]|uniref:PH domain-containing protein n=1 Tax=Streptomyces sp. NPDC002055 TaxID=3154534 RepID=UPI0033178BE8
MAAPGAVGYAALPMVTGVLALLVSLVPAWRQPELRIDAAGLTTVRGRRAATVPWADVEATGFTRSGGVLVLVLRAHATLPGGRELGRSRPVPYYALGVAVRGGPRRERQCRIRAAIDRFAPGRHAEGPVRAS